MRTRTCLALTLMSAVDLTLAISGCSLTPAARLDGHAWLLETTGKVSGADIQRDLGYRGISPQLDLEGSASIGRSSITADWAHLSRDASGTAPTSFNFGGVSIPTQSHITSHTDADLVSGFYGFKIGPDVFSITPGLGGGYARYDVKANGFSTNAGPLGGTVMIPFSAQSRNSQAFPIAALQLESIPIGYVDLVARVDGFGIPQGQIVDGMGLVRLRFEHVIVDAGYRYIRLNAGDSRINIKGAIVGAGVYF